MTPEGKVKKKVNDMLKAFGNHVWKFMPVQQGYGLPALDYLLSVNGFFVAIETKVPGKKPTPRQQLTMKQMRDAGATVFVVDDDLSLARCRAVIEDLIADQHCVRVRNALHTWDLLT